jgi:cellulose synthase/poly-beta-1,6-N-acetylglucosamine synthase-like glycosyltransferase
MVRGVLLVLEIIVAGLGLYNLTVSLWGWKDPPPSPGPALERRPFLVVIPAFNEERVIARPIEHLLGQLRHGDEVWVLADRCTDATAPLAREAGAQVLERFQGPDGKGAALRWFLDERPLSPDQALVVIDADNLVPPNLLSRFGEELGLGHQVLQAYLDISNPDQSPVATASALSYWASNRMVQLARTNLHWPADLGGTGMCLTARALEESGGFGTSLVEDQELGVRCFLAGFPVRWLHDLRVADEKPVAAEVAVSQRARWQSGRRHVARRWLLPLLKKRTRASWDLALRLIQPSRAGIALISAVLAIAAAVGAPLWPWQIWTAVALIQLLGPLAFLIRDGVPRRYLTRYPLLVLLPILKMLARFRRNRGWYHTPHGVNSPPP